MKKGVDFRHSLFRYSDFERDLRVEARAPAASSPSLYGAQAIFGKSPPEPDPPYCSPPSRVHTFKIIRASSMEPIAPGCTLSHEMLMPERCSI